MLQFVGPALQGASLIGRVGVPLLQQAGLAAGMTAIGAGINALTNKPQAKPQLTGRQKLGQAWGTIPDSLNYPQGGGFGYARGNNKRATQPSYQDAQGNTYDAVSGRLLYAAKPRRGSSPVGTSGGSLGGGSPAAEREFQAEVSRIAQLTAQDPELQRYERAAALARKPGATEQDVQTAEDIGMAMWAKANPKLAAKVKPGQSGYEVIQNELNAGQMGPVTNFPFDTTRPLSPTPIPPEQRAVTYEGVRPVSLEGVTPIVGGGFPTEQAAMFERFQQAIAPNKPTFQGSPLGTATPLVGNLSYTGSITPIGTAVEGGDFRSDKARKLAEMFKNAQFSS